MPHSARSIGGKAVALVWLFVVAVMLVAAHWAGSGPTQGSTSSRRWSPQLRPRLAREEVASATLSAQQFEDHKNGPSEGGNTQPASRAAHSRPQGQAVPQLPTSLGPATAQGSATVVQRTTAPGGGSSGGAPDGKEANPQPAATRGSSAAVTPAPAAANTPAAASTSADVTQPQEPRQQQQKQQTARKAAASLGTHSASISMQHVIPQALEQGKQGQVRVGAAPSVLAPWQLLSTPEALHVAPLRRTTAPGRGAVRAAAGATSQPSTGPAAAAAAAAAGARLTCTAEAEAAVLSPSSRKLALESTIHENSSKGIRCVASCLLARAWQRLASRCSSCHPVSFNTRSPTARWHARSRSPAARTPGHPNPRVKLLNNWAIAAQAYRLHGCPQNTPYVCTPLPAQAHRRPLPLS